MTVATNSKNIGLIEPDALFAERLQQVDSNTMTEQDSGFELSTELSSVETGLFDRVWEDHCHFYAGDSLGIGIAGLAGGAIMANSSIDEHLRHKVQQNIRSASSDEWFEMLHAQKELGNGLYTLPLFAASWMVGEYFDDDPRAVMVGDWGERSLRAFAVGVPPMLLTQRLTGASRPGESENDSHWNPLNDDNGVSGHSFMGAIPFLTAARMTDDPKLKFLYYTGSTLAPLSRVNDDSHYTSQAFLGWGFAWLATRAVFKTDSANQNWQINPILFDDKQGVAFTYQW
ncbi:MAG: hypothetical protein R3C11_00500 [Planctomycetaceae bacterium]